MGSNAVIPFVPLPEVYMSAILALSVWLNSAVAAEVTMDLGTHTIPVDLGASTLELPVTITAHSDDANPNRIGATIESPAAPLLPALEGALRDALPREDTCRRHIQTRGHDLQWTDGGLAVSFEARVRIRACEELFGKEIKTDLFDDTVDVHAQIGLGTSNGRLRLTLRTFELEKANELTRLLDLVHPFRPEVESWVARLNTDDGVALPPGSMGAGDFSYTTFTVDVSDASNPTLRLRADGTATAFELLEIIGRFKGD